MKVSIISITFNAGPLLERTILSIVNQSYTDFEYIIVDGKSSDNTLNIINKYEKIFLERSIIFRWFSKPDNGIYDAMNKGLDTATGDYVWFMNAGDKIASEDCLSNIINGLPDPQPDFIYGETLIVDENGTIMGERRLKAPEKLTWNSFKQGMLVCHQSMLVKRIIAPEFNLDYRYSADFDWAIKCLRKSSVIFNSGMVLSHFLDGGVSKKKMRASLKERFRIMAANYGWFSTAIRHIWFIFRAFWFKLIHGWI